MKWTNNENLPAPLCDALIFDDYELRGDISVTGLIRPPQISQLVKRHADEITRDVSDNLWIIMGKANHWVVDKSGQRLDCKTEHQVGRMVDDWFVTGTIDLIYKRAIYDYKFTSVWSVINKLKPEWEQQDNIYRFLTDDPIDKAYIICLLRDWQKNKAKADPEYPNVPVKILSVPLWPKNETEQFVKDRIRIHKLAESLPDSELPECTPEETWEKPTTYAVMKKGRKSAMRVLNDLGTAIEWKEKNGGTHIEKREGERTRCESYCDAKPFCHQYRKYREGK